MTPPPERDAHTPPDAVSFKLVQHRIPSSQTPLPARPVRGEHARDARLKDRPAHQPTPAECYGCVDWFQF